MKNNPPIQFKEGTHVLMLINRGIQNSNKGSKRWINKIVTTNPDEWDIAADKLMELQNYLGNPDIRLYSSVNSRNMDKAIKLFQHKQLDLLEDNKNAFYKRINDSFCSCLMQPESRMGNLFLIDCDTKDNTEINGFLVTNFGIRCYYQYPTKNGWHYIVEPFNPILTKDLKAIEIKKDALMLINWIEE